MNFGIGKKNPFTQKEVYLALSEDINCIFLGFKSYLDIFLSYAKEEKMMNYGFEEGKKRRSQKSKLRDKEKKRTYRLSGKKISPKKLLPDNLSKKKTGNIIIKCMSYKI